MDMKITIASCLAEIIRITVPNVPNDDELMKEVFRLFVDAIKKLNEISSPSYSKRVEILEGSENLKRDESSPEEIRNAEELPDLVTKNLVPTINSNSVLVPSYPEQESELSPQIYQLQSATISCRTDQDISSGSTNATLEILEDHNTKRMTGRKSKSSIMVDLQDNSQCARDKEALAMYTKRTNKTLEVCNLIVHLVNRLKYQQVQNQIKKTEIQSSSSLDRRNALLSSTSHADNLPDISNPKWGQPSAFTVNQDITLVADQLASICVRKEIFDIHQTKNGIIAFLRYWYYGGKH